MPSKIEWTDETWNPVTGCTPVSEGCANCYAKRMANRLRGRYGYPKNDPFRVTFHPDKLDKPLHWKKPRMVFVSSMGDLFHKDVKSEWINIVWHKAFNLPQHTFQILTKRPDRMLEWTRKADRMLEWTRKAAKVKAWPIEEIWPENVWLGVTAENQKCADERIPILLQIPAAVRFVSVEPMLGPVDLSPWICKSCKNGTVASPLLIHPKYGGGCGVCTNKPKLDQVICGGESGPGARPMHPNWARDLRDQCQDAGVPFFFKQNGAWAPEHALNSNITPARGFHTCHEFPGGQKVYKVGKKQAGRLLDGREWNGMPEGTGFPPEETRE